MRSNSKGWWENTAGESIFCPKLVRLLLRRHSQNAFYVLILSLHCREDSSLKLVSTHNKAQCVQCVIPSAVLHLVIIKLARLRSSGVSPDVTQPAITSHRGARIKTNLNGLSSPRLRTLSSLRLKTPAQCSASLLSEQSRALLWQPGGWLDLGDCTTQHSNTKDTAG